MQCPFDDILRDRERIGWMQRPFDDVLRNHQQGRRGSLLAVRRNFDENLGYAGSSGYGAVVRKSSSVNQSRWRRLQRSGEPLKPGARDYSGGAVSHAPGNRSRPSTWINPADAVSDAAPMKPLRPAWMRCSSEKKAKEHRQGGGDVSRDNGRDCLHAPRLTSI